MTSFHKKTERSDISDKTFGNVPGTGLEPAHLLQYKNLNLVCLPISPPGLRGMLDIGKRIA